MCLFISKFVKVGVFVCGVTPADQEAFCEGVGRGRKSRTTSGENGEWCQYHQTRSRESKHTQTLNCFHLLFSVNRTLNFIFCLLLCLFPPPRISCPSLHFLHTYTPACLPLCILFCVSPHILSSFSSVICPALKAKQHANARTHSAEECRSDYAAQLQKYNKEQNLHYFKEIPHIYNVRRQQRISAHIHSAVQLDTLNMTWHKPNAPLYSANTDHVSRIWNDCVAVSMRWTEPAEDGWAEDQAAGAGLLSVLRHREERAAHHLQVSRGNLCSRAENWRESGKRFEK